MSETTLSDFYMRCDNLHRELYSVIAREWQEAGQIARLGDDGLILCLRSVGAGGDEGLPLFELLPGAGIDPATIALNLDEWRRWFGEEERDAMLRKIEAIHGLQHKLRDGICSIVDPGHISGAMQQALRDLMLDMARRGPDLIAS